MASTLKKKDSYWKITCIFMKKYSMKNSILWKNIEDYKGRITVKNVPLKAVENLFSNKQIISSISLSITCAYTWCRFLWTKCSVLLVCIHLHLF